MSRRRYRFDEDTKQMVEVGSDWTDTPRGGSHRSEAEIFGDVRSTDGVDISSRKKRRDYMRANNLTDPSDFKGHHYGAKAGERARFFTSGVPKDSRKESIARAMDQLSRSRR